MKRFANPDLLSNARTDQSFDAVLTFFFFFFFLGGSFTYYLVILFFFFFFFFLKRLIYLFADL